MFTVNQVVVFSKVPAGSYLRTGEQYRIERMDKRFVSFRNVVRGSGTFDNISLFKRAAWTVVA